MKKKKEVDYSKPAPATRLWDPILKKPNTTLSWQSGSSGREPA
jgi:hypothetical protein